MLADAAGIVGAIGAAALLASLLMRKGSPSPAAGEQAVVFE